jgi:lipopolysaccharide export LptBFGC system permease protein LptF
MYYLSRNFTDQPAVLKFFFMGIFISTSIGLVFNNFIKISLHAMAAGGAVMAIILFSYYYQVPFGFFISLALILAGMICTSRLLVSDHTQAEIYYGLLVGSGCQFISYLFVM